MLFLRFARLRRWFWLKLISRYPERFWAADLDVATAIYRPLIVGAKGNTEKTRDLNGEFDAETIDARTHLKALNDNRLVKTARSMYISLEEMPKPPSEQHPFEFGGYGDMATLHDVTRNALFRAVRDEQRKKSQETRAWIELFVKALAAIVGIVGALIGLVSVAKK